MGTGRVRETRRADQKQGLPLGWTAALQRRAEFLEFHPALPLERRFQAIDVTIGAVFDFAASPAPCPNRIPSRLQPSCRNVRPREHEQENQDGINRDRHGVSGRNPPLLFRPFGHDAPSPEQPPRAFLCLRVDPIGPTDIMLRVYPLPHAFPPTVWAAKHTPATNAGAHHRP